MRKIAAGRGLDPDQWLNNVEFVTAEKLGIETTTYVRNIYKYYIAYKLTVAMQEARKQARDTLTLSHGDSASRSPQATQRVTDGP